MIIKVVEIPPSSREYRFEIGMEELSKAIEGWVDCKPIGPSAALVSAYRVDWTINLQGRMTFPALIACARCGEELHPGDEIHRIGRVYSKNNQWRQICGNKNCRLYHEDCYTSMFITV